MNTKQRLIELSHQKEKQSLVAENRALQKELSVALERLQKIHGKAVSIGPARTFKRSKADRTRAFCCDLHGAKMHKPTAAAFIADMKVLQPDEIILGGDMVDVGGFLALHHVLGYVAEIDYSYDDDIAATAKFIDELQKACPNAAIVYIEGNHENRVEKWACTQTLRHHKDADGLRKRNAPEYLLHLEKRGIPYIRMSECYDGLSIQGTIRRGKCYFTHGSFARSKNAARDVVAKFAGNVVFGNTHRADVYIGRRPNVGVIGGYNPGCMCELQPTWCNTDPTDWSRGYAVQFVAATQDFLHINIPIIDGRSLMLPFMNKVQ